MLIETLLCGGDLMIIRLKVFEQTLSIVDTKSVPRKGSKDYLVLQFMFSSDWKDLNKLCYLQKGEVSQPIDVINNLVKVPEWFTQQDHFYITLFGKNDNQEVPTNVVPLRLDKSNTLWEKDAPEPQPSWIVKLIDINNHPPVPGENGYWMIWDTDSGAYIESDLPQSSVQPDWNQNDDTKPDYVKNRPFYTGDPTENVLFNGSFVFTIIGMGPIGERGVYNGVTDFSPEIGQTYQVSWDGAVYSCVGTEYDSLIALGNLSIMNFGSDTGEPFLMTCGTGSINIYTQPVGSSHTISIGKMVSPVVQIDPKYIRDMYYTEILGKSIEGIEIANLPINGTLDENIPLEIGQIWNVGYKDGSGYINTSDYTNLEVQRAEDGTLYIGDYPDAHNYPFYITATSVKSNPLWISNMGISSIILFGVSGTIPEEVVHKIDKKYLVQPDWNQNDSTAADFVKNRPFYAGDPVETVLVEESTATFTENSGLYMANFPSTFSATVGEIYNISWDGTVYECTCVTVSEMPFPLIGNLSIIGAGSDTGEPFIAAAANGEGISILTSDTSDSHTFSISKTVVPVVKIDEKYLPDVRSDWNVNDETSLSYVKNRPFYTGDPVETVLLEETTVRFSKNGEIYVGRLSPYTGSFPDEGKIYDVNWDGSIYQCPCYLDGSILTLGVLGNPDPFSIAFLADSSSLGIVTKTANSHTISISGFIDEIVKIDKKYLPELPKLPYMAEENPTGTGAFSLNRMVGSYVGIKSFAEGLSTTATGDASHAEGSSTTASGSASHAEGRDTLASGHNSHAEGSYTTAWGNCSHAEGSSLNKAPKMAYGNSSNTTIINKWKSGNFTLAKGLSSHAEGKNVLALGENSHAEGVATFANGDSSHVQGKFNIADDGNLYAHIVGNGTSDASRSNAHTLDWSGNAWFAGNVEGKALIISSSTEGSTKKFKITVDDSGTITATEVP